MERAQIPMRRKGRGARARAGETMIETVIAFSMLLLMLATVSFMLRFALNENSRALARMDALEAAETEIEKGLGTNLVMDTLHVSMGGNGSAIIPSAISAPIQIAIKESGELVYFAD